MSAVWLQTPTQSLSQVGLEPDLACTVPRGKGAGAEAQGLAGEGSITERLEHDPCISLARQHLQAMAALQLPSTT